MRPFIAAAAVAAFITTPVLANPGKPIETGAQLLDACKAFAAADGKTPENAIAPPNACKGYLSGFVRAYQAQQQASLNAALQGTSSGGGGETLCIAFPDFLSFKDFAQIVVAYAEADPARAGEPAYDVTGHALAEKYPCAEQ